MSFLRVVFILILLFILVFIPYPFIRLPVLVIVLLLFFSAIMLQLTLRSLCVTRLNLTTWGEPGKRIPVSLVMENKGFLPIWSFIFVDQVGQLSLKSTSKKVFSLKAYEQKIFTYEISSSQRGEYEIGPAVLRGTDLLGFFHFYKHIILKGRVIIYPELYPVRVSSANGLPAGSISAYSHVFDDVTKTHSLREYISGDDMRYIHWKVSASKGKLYTKEFLPSIYFQVMFILNINTEDYPIRMRNFLIERMISSTASMATTLSRQGIDIGLLTQTTLPEGIRNIKLPAASSESALIRLLEELACLKSVHASGFDPSAWLAEGTVAPSMKYFYIGPMPASHLLEKWLNIPGMKSRFEFYFLEPDDKQQAVADSRFHFIKNYGRDLLG